jgi:hypothetical protein
LLRRGERWLKIGLDRELPGWLSQREVDRDIGSLSRHLQCQPSLLFYDTLTYSSVLSQLSPFCLLYVCLLRSVTPIYNDYPPHKIAILIVKVLMRLFFGLLIGRWYGIFHVPFELSFIPNFIFYIIAIPFIIIYFVEAFLFMILTDSIAESVAGLSLLIFHAVFPVVLFGPLPGLAIQQGWTVKGVLWLSLNVFLSILHLWLFASFYRLYYAPEKYWDCAPIKIKPSAGSGHGDALEPYVDEADDQ